MQTRSVPAVFFLGALLLAASHAIEPPTATLTADDVRDLYVRFQRFHDRLPEPAKLGLARLVAFEEHAQFTFVMGELPGRAGLRRLVFVKGGGFIVDDQFADGHEAGRWVLASPDLPRADGAAAQVGEGAARLVCRALLPAGAAFKVIDQEAGDARSARHGVEITGGKRFVVALHVGGGELVKVAAVSTGGTVIVKLAMGKVLHELHLPAGTDAGTVAVTEGERTVLPRRLLAAGIMPHGPRGVRMIARWDSRYRGKARAPWDTGRPDAQLVQAVESGTLKPGRIVVLGCGSGTNAVYLATKGFDVTALDVAATALSIARDKAARAGVSVRWLVADVLAPPALEPFEIIFDRACYHGVRRGNAAGYVKTTEKLSKPGTTMLILAGNANEPRHYGPPRVEELDLVRDFAGGWDLVHLREVRGGGAWFWSALFRRKAK